LAFVEELEKWTDQQLLERYSGQQETVSIPLSKTSGGLVAGISLPAVVIAELKQRYEAAGWEVKYSSNQRDGAYINLTPKN